MLCGLAHTLMQTFFQNALRNDDVRSAVWAGSTVETSVAGGYKSSIEIVGSLLSHALLPVFYQSRMRKVLCLGPKISALQIMACLALPSNSSKVTSKSTRTVVMVALKQSALRLMCASVNLEQYFRYQKPTMKMHMSCASRLRLIKTRQRRKLRRECRVRCSSIKPVIFHAFSTFYIISQLRVTETTSSQSDAFVPNSTEKLYMFLRARVFSSSSLNTHDIICMTLSSCLKNGRQTRHVYETRRECMGWRWVWWWRCPRWVCVPMMMIGIMVAD